MTDKKAKSMACAAAECFTHRPDSDPETYLSDEDIPKCENDRVGYLLKSCVGHVEGIKSQISDIKIPEVDSLPCPVARLEGLVRELETTLKSVWNQLRRARVLSKRLSRTAKREAEEKQWRTNARGK